MKDSPHRSRHSGMQVWSIRLNFRQALQSANRLPITMLTELYIENLPIDEAPESTDH